MEKLQKIVQPLLAWYPEHHRDLAWRRTKDPYLVWVSEIMLQQTRVEAVKGYFERFLKAFPTVFDLATAKEDDLMKLWEGLGYYSRARNMQKAAKEIAEKRNGVFPDTYEEILALPGVGEYTAGAVASIAFNQRVSAVDGNVLRVVTRFLADDRNISQNGVKAEIRERLNGVYPEEASAFTQALMELGATVCLPNGVPDCEKCPLREKCLSHERSEETLRPVKNPKKERKVQDLTVFLIRCGDCVAVEKRKEKGVLFGLYQFPNVSGILSAEKGAEYLASLGAKGIVPHLEMRKKHIFTHIEWRMKAISFSVEKPFGKFEWVTGEEMEKEVGLPSAFRKFYPF